MAVYNEVVMDAPNYSAAKTYAAVGIESQVIGADPHRLILLLYGGAIAALGKAKSRMQRNEIAEKSAAIAQAVAIINDGLRASLDMKQGGEISANLDALYDYMCQQLLVANIKNDQEPIDETVKLLSELKGAWEAIGKTSRPVEGDQPPPSDRTGVSYGEA